MTPVALTIAGSDPSGGAGVQADLKTFHQHGVYGTSVITLLTVQNTQSVLDVEILRPEFILAQLEAVLEDIPPAAAKIGALGTAEVIRAVARRAGSFNFPLVVDPVMISKHGVALLDCEAADVMRRELLPAAFLVTPNSLEASRLSGIQVDDPASMEEAAAAIASLGPRNVLIKGGHLTEDARDVLWAGGTLHRLHSDRLESRNTHGTGCVLSAAITARLARGEGLMEAVRGAKRFITQAIRTSPGLGRGLGPTNLHIETDPR